MDLSSCRGRASAKRKRPTTHFPTMRSTPMKRFLLLPLFAALLPPAHAGDAPKTFGNVDRRDPAFYTLIPRDAKIEKLAEGFKWTEGPVWIKDKGYVLFSDIPNNAIHQWTPGKGLTRDFIKPAGYTGKT